MRPAPIALRSLILGFALASVTWSLPAAPQTQVSLHSDFTSIGVMTDVYNDVIASTFKFAAPTVAERLTINGACAAEKVCVYLVDGAALAQRKANLRSALGRDIAQYVQRNAVTRQPNIIVFDYRLVNDVLINALNDLSALGQALESMHNRGMLDLSRDDAKEELHKWSLVVDYYRYQILRATLSGTSSFDSTAMARKVAEGFRESNTTAPVAPALAPIVLHELGHLQASTQGQLVEPIETLVKNILEYPARQKLLRAEEAADEFAANQLKASFLRLSQDPKTAKSAQANEGLEAVIATLKYLRDVALVDGFQTFRGLQPEDLFVNFVHKDCSKEPKTKDMHFANPGKIQFAYFEYFPVLTTQEFQQIRTGLLRRIQSGTHPHHFSRAGRILSSIEPQFSESDGRAIRERILGPAAFFLEAVIQDDPLLLRKDLKGNIGMTRVAALKGIEVGFDVVPGATCVSNECWVGTLKSKRPGFVEIIGPPGNLRRLRLTLPMFGNQGVASLNDANAEAYIENMAVVLRFATNATGEQVDLNSPETFARSKAAGMIVTFRKMLLDCGAATFQYREGGRTIIFRTVNDQGWVSIEVMPVGID